MKKGENLPQWIKEHGPWNKGTHLSGMKGKKHSPETIQKMKGKKRTLEHRKRQSERQKGANSNLWKGGISPINERIRKSLKYKIWRWSVFERDDFTCKKCKKRGGKLHADHIKRFSDFPKLRFVVSNGRTLCEDCHRETDTYGNRKQK